jgi:biopolymer transport protein ExbB
MEDVSMKRRVMWVLVVGLVLGLVAGFAPMLLAQEKAAPKVAGTEEEMAKKKADENVTGLWYLYKASMPEGGLITACSVWMFAVIFANAMSLRHKLLIPPEVVEQTDALLRQKKAKDALEVCQASDSLIGKMMAAGISRMSRGYEEALEYQSEIGQEEVMKMNHKLSYLTVIGAISPMLGLLGTVRGMIQAFQQIATSGAQPSPAELSNNIQLALVTTFEGLVVAIPAIFAYSLFRNHLARTATEADMIVGELMSRFQGVTTPLTRFAQPAAPAAAAKPAAAPGAPAKPAETKPAAPPKDDGAGSGEKKV